jgi:hypothetical protein
MKKTIFAILLLLATTAQSQITVTPTGSTFTLTETDFFTGDGWALGRSRIGLDTSSVVNYITLKIEDLYREEARAYKTLLDAQAARRAYLTSTALVTGATYNQSQNAKRDSVAFTGNFTLRVNGGSPFNVSLQYRVPPQFNRLLAENGTLLASLRPLSANSFSLVFQTTEAATAIVPLLAGQTLTFVRDGRRWQQPVENLTRVILIPR